MHWDKFGDLVEILLPAFPLNLTLKLFWELHNAQVSVRMQSKKAKSQLLEITKNNVISVLEFVKEVWLLAMGNY